MVFQPASSLMLASFCLLGSQLCNFGRSHRLFFGFLSTNHQASRGLPRCCPKKETNKETQRENDSSPNLADIHLARIIFYCLGVCRCAVSFATLRTKDDMEMLSDLVTWGERFLQCWDAGTYVCARCQLAVYRSALVLAQPRGRGLRTMQERVVDAARGWALRKHPPVFFFACIHTAPFLFFSPPLV